MQITALKFWKPEYTLDLLDTPLLPAKTLHKKVTFTVIVNVHEILNGKLHFLRSKKSTVLFFSDEL